MILRHMGNQIPICRSVPHGSWPDGGRRKHTLELSGVVNQRMESQESCHDIVSPCPLVECCSKLSKGGVALDPGAAVPVGCRCVVPMSVYSTEYQGEVHGAI